MHAETGHQPIQHQLEKRRQQHELDGVFEQGTEIADLSYQAITDCRRFHHGQALHRRALYLSGKNRVNAPNLSEIRHDKRTYTAAAGWSKRPFSKAAVSEEARHTLGCMLSL
jgi:hypothetical protein